MTPSFSIEPWELPPDCKAPLTAPVDLIVACHWSFTSSQQEPHETQLWFRTVRTGTAYVHYFCDASHPDDGNWIFSDRGRYIPISKFPLNAPLIERIFKSEDARWLDSISRLVYFEGAAYGHAGMHRIKVNPDGYGLFGLATEPSWEFRKQNALFRIPTRDGRVAANATTLKTQLLESLRDSASEARFAFDWVHLSEQERCNTLLQFERGDTSEIQRLLHPVLQSEPDIWEGNEPLRWKLCLKYRHRFRTSDSLELADPTPNILSGQPTDVKIPPRLKNWKKLLWNHFAPSVNEEIPRFSLCARHWETEADVGTIAVEAAPPTAHERLEALLTLRDWWQQNFPDQPFEKFPVRRRKSTR